MTQRKKDDVRTAILEAAFRQFSERSYTETTLPQIAREAGISTANVYVYFGSKLDILFTLYEPWLTGQLDRIEKKLRRIADPASRIEQLLLAMWRDLPKASNGFAHNVMQAIATSSMTGDYRPDLRQLFQRRLTDWIAEVLGLSRSEADQLATVVLMAFDGFAMNARLPQGVVCNPALARTLSRLLAAPAGRAVMSRSPPASNIGR